MSHIDNIKARNLLSSRIPVVSGGMIQEVFDDRRHLLNLVRDLVESGDELLPILQRMLKRINPDGAAETSASFQIASARVERLRLALAKAKA